MMANKPLALVTGGASGMGLATVERLARHGFRLALIDPDPAPPHKETARRQAFGWNVACHVLDLTDEAAVPALAQALPPITALVNNAGAFGERPFLEVTRADFRRAYQITLIAVATVTQASVERMPGGGRIVNIASRAYLGARNPPHYVASKAALVGYTRASALELAPRGSLANAIAPGLIATPMLRALSPARLRAQLALQPTGQAGRPEDIAQAVSFLVAPQAGFLTGHGPLVGGGKSLGGIAA